MEKVFDVAEFFYNEYYNKFNETVDEMKLHKFLYFAQRESLILKNEPLFEENFYGWKFGPVLKSVRRAYKQNKFKLQKVDSELVDRLGNIINSILDMYGSKSSWSLSRITHGEISWRNSRKGISKGENGDMPILLDDIRKDAERIKYRRKIRKELKIG